MFKADSKDTKRRHCHRSAAFTVKVEHILHLLLVFLLLNLNK